MLCTRGKRVQTGGRAGGMMFAAYFRMTEHQPTIYDIIYLRASNAKRAQLASSAC